MIGVLLKKQIYERLSYFKRNRKNVDVAGMFLSLLLAAVVIFIVALVFTEFVKKYLSVRLDNVIDVSARCYELMTLIYEIVFVVSVFGSVTSLTRAVFESDDRNVHIKTVLAAGNSVNLNAELLLNSLLSQFAAETESISIVRTKLLREDLSIFE